MNISMDIPEASQAVQDHSRIVAPPARLTSFDPRPGEGPSTWIDYEQHPGYASLAHALSVKHRLASLARFARYFAMIVCKRVISYELIPAHLRAMRSSSAIIGFLGAATSNVLQKLLTGSRAHRADAGAAVTQTLQSDGICVIRTADQAFNRICQAAAPLLERLRSTRGRQSLGGRDFAESRASALRTENADLFACVEQMLTQSGVLDGCSAYLGHSAKLVDVNPQINDSSDDFWQRVFPDLPSSPLPTAYLHRDASGGDIKAILYLSDVGPDNGPFSYALGSHRVPRTRLTDWIEETNDQSGASGTARADRQSFIALPAKLQRKCAFGNDILPATEIATRLNAAEWTIEARRGHLVIFDTKGFHRGGMVKEDERVVLTCVIGTARR